MIRPRKFSKRIGTRCARIAEALLEREVLDANEVRMIIQNIPLEEKAELVADARSGDTEPKKQVVQSLTPSVPSLVDKQREKPAPA